MYSQDHSFPHNHERLIESIMCIYVRKENFIQGVNVLVSKEACKVPDQNIRSIGEISLISHME